MKRAEVQDGSLLSNWKSRELLEGLLGRYQCVYDLLFGRRLVLVLTWKLLG